MKLNPKILLALLIIVLFCIFYFGGYGKIATIDNLLLYKDLLSGFIASNLVVSAMIFVFVYIVAISLSLPGASILTISGGFLFGILGLPLVIISATLGAIINFIAGRYIFGKAIQVKYQDKLSSFNNEIESNGASYLLTLRLLPIFPFFVINLLASVSKIKLSTFAWTTLIGIIPGSAVYWYAGTQLSALDSTKNIITPNIILAFVLLALLSLVPTFIKKFQK
jgi:uncharacterized membrane protein YdjX (TVP38/TMEM64 family)